MPLKNASNIFDHGKANPFSVGFTARDGENGVLVMVLDQVLEGLEESRRLQDYKAACEKHLGRLLKAASAKYDSGGIEADGSILLKSADVGPA